MEIDLAGELKQAMFQAIPELFKNLWPYVLIMVLILLATGYVNAWLYRRNHERVWKTKKTVQLLEDINKNTSPKNVENETTKESHN